MPEPNLRIFATTVTPGGTTSFDCSGLSPLSTATIHMDGYTYSATANNLGNANGILTIDPNAPLGTMHVYIVDDATGTQSNTVTINVVSGVPPTYPPDTGLGTGPQIEVIMDRLDLPLIIGYKFTDGGSITLIINGQRAGRIDAWWGTDTPTGKVWLIRVIGKGITPGPGQVSLLLGDKVYLIDEASSTVSNTVTASTYVERTTAPRNPSLVITATQEEYSWETINYGLTWIIRGSGFNPGVTMALVFVDGKRIGWNVNPDGTFELPLVPSICRAVGISPRVGSVVYALALWHPGNLLVGITQSNTVILGLVGQIQTRTSADANPKSGAAALQVSFAGSLVRADTGQPLPGMAVQIIVNDTLLGSVTTDPQGQFSTPITLEKGTWTLKARFPGI